MSDPLRDALTTALLQEAPMADALLADALIAAMPEVKAVVEAAVDGRRLDWAWDARVRLNAAVDALLAARKS